MSDEVIVKVRTPGGDIREFKFAEILEVDGRTFRSREESEDIEQAIVALDAQVQELRGLVYTLLKPQQT